MTSRWHQFADELSGRSRRRELAALAARFDRSIEQTVAQSPANRQATKNVLALDRLERLEAEWRGYPVRDDRINEQLRNLLDKAGLTGGRVLEIGGRDHPRARVFDEDTYVYDNLDIDAGIASIPGDITDCPQIPDATFDVILSVDVFEHIKQPWLAAREITRLLAPGGFVYTSTLFSWRYHPCPVDFWRYTPDALEFLFADLDLLDSGFDLTERRRDFRKKAAADPAALDALGGWRGERPRLPCRRQTGSAPVTGLRTPRATGSSELPETTFQPGAGVPAWKVHVIADSDTRWKWGAALGARLSGPDGQLPQVHGHLLEGRATPTDQQLADIGAPCASLRRQVRTDAATDPVLAEADVIVLACVGGTVQALLHGLARAWEGRITRPVVVTGYVGLVYERMVDGLLLRAGADLILANSAHDARRFRSVFQALGIDTAAIVQSALPFLGGRHYDSSAVGRDRPLTVCFVSQPSVPVRRDERRFLLERVIEHAGRHPERRVLVKLRSRPGEQTTHIERHHFAQLPTSDRPGNVEFVYGLMADVLDETDLCVTVSSTAALEAMHRGIPTAVLTDFGIRESLGNHAFLASGCLTSFDDIDRGVLPTVDGTWAAENGIADADPFAAAQNRVITHARAGDLRPLRPWYEPSTAGGYLPRLLARNGFDVDGEALVGGIDESGGPAALRRRIARGSARTVYRLGVHHLEPAVRRWAQL